MRKSVRLFAVIAFLGLSSTACGDTGDEAEAIHGTWKAPLGVYEVYETFYPDGTWDVYENDDPPHSWGTFTLDDGVLTLIAADDAWCPGSIGVFEVTIAEDGSELHRKIVSETCTESARGRIPVFTRHTP